jgi:hypothetical protein
MGISRAGSARGKTVAIGGAGGVERPEGALRIRKRCLSDDVRGTLGSARIGVGTTRGGGGSGPVGGGLGGTSSAGGMT